jgi:hypothetical protein
MGAVASLHDMLQVYFPSWNLVQSWCHLKPLCKFLKWELDCLPPLGYYCRILKFYVVIYQKYATSNKAIFLQYIKEHSRYIVSGFSFQYDGSNYQTIPDTSVTVCTQKKHKHPNKFFMKHLLYKNYKYEMVQNFWLYWTNLTPSEFVQILQSNWALNFVIITY